MYILVYSIKYHNTILILLSIWQMLKQLCDNTVHSVCRWYIYLQAWRRQLTTKKKKICRKWNQAIFCSIVWDDGQSEQFCPKQMLVYISNERIIRSFGFALLPSNLKIYVLKNKNRCSPWPVTTTRKSLEMLSIYSPQEAFHFNRPSGSTLHCTRQLRQPSVSQRTALIIVTMSTDEPCV